LGQFADDIQRYDRRLRDALEALEPKALADWDAATAAREARDATRSAEGYRRVIELAPTFSHAHRRLCTALLREDRAADAIAQCRKAVELEPLIENLAALALALASGPRARDTTAEAIDLVRATLAADPDVANLIVICETTMRLKDVEDLDVCTNRLLLAEPNGALANYFATVLYASRGLMAEARQALERAHGAGFPEPAYREMLVELTGGEPRTGRWADYQERRAGRRLVVAAALRAR